MPLELSPILGPDARPYNREAATLSHKDNWLAGVSRSRYDVRIHTWNEGMANPAVWRCLTFLSDKLRVVPLHTRRNLPEGGSEVDRQHQAYRLLRRQAVPRWISAGQWRATSGWIAAYFGDHLSGIVRDENFAPTQLIPFTPDRTSIKYDRQAGQIFYRLKYSIDGGPDTWHNVIPEDVFHVRGALSIDGLRSLPFWEYASLVIGAGNAARDYAGGVHSRGAIPSATCTFPLGMPQDKRKDYQNDFGEKMAGFGRTGQVLFIENDQTFTPHSTTAKDAEMAPGRKLADNEIAMFFGFPSTTVNSTESESYGSREQQSQDETEAMDTWFVRYEEECWEKLLTTDQQDSESHKCEFQREAMLRLDHKTMIDSMILELQWGLLLVNEGRVARNRPVYPETGNQPMFPVNYGTLGGIEGGGGGGQREAVARARHRIGTQLQRRLTAAEPREALGAWVDDTAKRDKNEKAIRHYVRQSGLKPNRSRKLAKRLVAVMYDSVHQCLTRNEGDQLRPAAEQLVEVLTHGRAENGRH